ncbi:hypothetical protein ASE61_11950 [Bosea sp. Root670]|uniref:cysteine rich repeat-containing protein n=1 Tax=Bosea sp. Root670 TaxID=1736583 RepID=UPI0007156641|nr:cysteine rich repeat-containing protein [Bosea sp. Root670]KRE03199.1 hypothetical protein ASE61_11950 [Bosea sp. Root670]
MITTRHPADLRLAWAALVLTIGSAETACAQQRANPAIPTEAKAFIQACSPDYVRHCSGVRPGGGRSLACLRALDRQRLSSSCREALPEGAAQQSKATAAGAMPR